jgi:hypothetical protein
MGHGMPGHTFHRVEAQENLDDVFSHKQLCIELMSAYFSAQMTSELERFGGAHANGCTPPFS